MKLHHRTLPACAFILILTGVAIMVARFKEPREAVQTAKEPQIDVTTASKAKPVRTNPLSSAFGNLSEQSERNSTIQSLTDLLNSLKSLPPDEAVAIIRQFLDGGMDKNTGLSFEIGNDGMLGEWPTFRTFLLDALLAIDPAAAAEISRGILSSPTTADEWALALRNVGRSGTDGETRELLRTKTEELINTPEWQANPSIGYLNAFDVLVHINATASTPLLSNLIQRKDRKDLAHASFLTLDRLVQRSPADVLARIAADRALQQSRPEMAAQQVARADLRDPAQREIVRNWLLDPARTGTELGSFAGVYPNNNRFISKNLLSRDDSPSGSDLAAHDREVQEIIRAWEQDPAFDSVRNHLGTMTQRLNQFSAAPAE